MKKLSLNEMAPVQGGVDSSTWCGAGIGIAISGLAVLAVATGGAALAIGGATYLIGGALLPYNCIAAITGKK